MKNFLNYQTSEYDCGPVCLLNAIRFLFHREDIYPDLVKFIMMYGMDTYNEQGEICKRGTSRASMQYMTCWLNDFANMRKFPIRCEYLSGKDVTITPDSRITTSLRQGGVALVQLFLDVEHYVLLTGVEDNRILLFDPYYEELDDPELDEDYNTDEIRFILDQPKRANRSVSMERMNRFSHEYYEMGDYSYRQAILLFHDSSFST